VTDNDRSQPTPWATGDDDKVEPSRRTGEHSQVTTRAESEPHPPKADGLTEQMLARPNLQRALQRVESNGGAPGPDGMTTNELRSFLNASWPDIAGRLARCTY
jgi:RNA-directed DNA polymerase